jgi:uncharacterized protein YllA (UPF0747 family)
VAYFAQATAVADALGVPRPVVGPRWSTTIIEPRVQRALDELDITLTELATPHAVEGRLARARLPADTDRAVRALRDDLASHVDALRRTSQGIVPDPVIGGLERALSHRVDRFERRLLAGVKRREDSAMQKVAAARGALFPHGTRQERKLAFVPFLARYGPALVGRMLEEARVHARALVLGAPSVTAHTAQAPAAL